MNEKSRETLTSPPAVSRFLTYYQRHLVLNSSRCSINLGDELFIATSAFGELASRNSSLATNMAWEILSNSQGDRYLQATALETLFQGNRELALDMSR